MTSTKNQHERIAIIARMSITSLHDSLVNKKNYFELDNYEISELEKFAKIFNYKQSKSSKENGISYLRAFYYYLCK